MSGILRSWRYSQTRLTVIGSQGHVAYPLRANNPSNTIIKILKRIKETKLDNGTKNLGTFSSFIKNLSKDFPIQYGIISIIFAIVLGISAAFIRRFFSNLRKKYNVKT